MSLTQDLLNRRAAAVASSAATTHPMFLARADGAELYDVDGKHYVDFASGIAVLNLGHRHPRVTAAIKGQLDAYAHVGFPVNSYEPYVAVCEELNRRAPIAEPRSALFTTGAEAVENAVKVARIATGRVGVIAFTGSFHGRTQLAAALTGKIAPLRSGVAPVQAGIHHVAFPGQGATEAEAIQGLEQLFKATLPPDQVAAIIIEPVQGEGGFVPAPKAFMRHLRQLCDRHGIVLIADEIQSGFGRTGKFFAIEHYDIRPDIIAVGKALGGGLPLAGIVGRADLMNRPVPGALGGTFAGSPVACAAALAVFAAIDEEGLLARADHIGAKIAERLRETRHGQKASPVGEIRQTGAMVAFDVVDAHNAFDPAKTKQLADQAREAGVLFLPCGYYGATIRLSPPLTISDAVLDEGLKRLISVVDPTSVTEFARA
jgi:4-aminobutyrate aminotransferase/(S)-3-amino-2-methylpropionate transaminase